MYSDRVNRSSAFAWGFIVGIYTGMATLATVVWLVRSGLLNG